MKKRLLIIALTLVTVFTTLTSGFTAKDVQAADIRKCYTISTSNTPVYGDPGLTRRIGTIYPSDLLTVTFVSGNYAIATYPISNSNGATKTGYIRRDAIFTQNTHKLCATKKYMTTYKRPNSSETFGSVNAGEVVYKYGKVGNYTQIRYKVDGTNYYKIAFVYTGTSSSSGNSISTNAASKLVAYENSQIGTGDYLGNNNVKYNTWYYNRTVSGSGYAWCMAFQSYCANQCGISTNIIPKTASCNTAMNWFKNNGRWQPGKYYGGSYTPKAGDLVFYGTGSSNSNHVGLVVAAPVNGYLQVVEGNVKSSNGNYVVAKFTANSKRTLGSSYVLGYATPAY